MFVPADESQLKSPNIVKGLLYIFRFLFFHSSFVYLIFHIRPKTIKISSVDGANETKILIIKFRDETMEKGFGAKNHNRVPRTVDYLYA